ncbi:lipid droplet-associated protein [Rhodococcus sp. WS4]|nr:lipid droplet-associated protein [Rhodococcus sp. WS4]
MIRPPFVARVAAGIAVTAVEEARKLPTTAATLPMTAVSQVLQTTMRVQQSMTALAIKGDQAFALINWTHDDEQPAWAVFDEDTAAEAAVDGTDDRPAGPGRFALYSLSPQDESTPAKISTPKAAPPATNGAAPAKSATKKAPTSAPAVAEPEIAVVLDYGTLTLAQLRARLRSLSVEDLTTLLDYENATLARAPFQTMLTNRITTAKAK